MRFRPLFFALLLGLSGVQAASAQVVINARIGAPYYRRPYYGPRYYYPPVAPPVVIAPPPPVYYAPPAPVYYAPPVIIAPPPVYYAPRPYYGRGYRGRGALRPPLVSSPLGHTQGLDQQ